MYLETERLLLRSQQNSDIPALVELWTNPTVTSYVGGPRDRADLAEVFAAEGDDEVYDLWPVIEKASGQVVGHCGLLDKEIAETVDIEINYFFTPETWGKGYATEIALALKHYAERELGLSRLVALIEPGNIGSAHVAEKIGMTLEQEVVRPGGAVKHLYAMRLGE